MITTITLNPMLDKTVTVDRLERGKIHRASKIAMIPGGKGINVSRQLRRWGTKTTATGFLGGEVGSIVKRLLDEEGVEHDFVITDAMTREGVEYLEPDGTWTAVFEPSLPIGQRFVHDLTKKIDALTAKSTWIVCGGSSPGPEADDVFYEAIMSAHKAGISSVLDSYAIAFELGMKAMPTLVKPNKHEFETTFQRSLKSESDYKSAINLLQSKGAQYCVLTDGANVFYAGIRGHTWKINPPKVKAVNSIGSGDAMVAGILHGFHQGWKFERCLVFGAAAGAANAKKWEVATSTLEDVAALEVEVAIERI
jgi:tagatose 6-phosphate kinase